MLQSLFFFMLLNKIHLRFWISSLLWNGWEYGSQGGHMLFDIWRLIRSLSYLSASYSEDQKEVTAFCCSQVMFSHCSAGKRKIISRSGFLFREISPVVQHLGQGVAVSKCWVSTLKKKERKPSQFFERALPCT